MTEDALRSVFGIDPARFNRTFAEYWQNEDSGDNRVHVETVVEREVIDAIDEWSNRIYQEASNGDPNTGLFLIIEGAQATGKTAMTRYIHDQFDPVANEARQKPPIVLPVWQKAESNPSSYKYLKRLQNEGREYFGNLEDVPDLDQKLSLLDEISTQLSEDELAALADGRDISVDEFQDMAERAGFFDEGTDPADVVETLAGKGYIFVFIFDEMVPSHSKEEAQNVLKWFEKHLNPNVGFVLFCHPDISSITRNDMFDQMRRRNGDIVLDIAGTEYRLDQNHVINIRGRQDQLIDLRRLLEEYFADVYTDGQGSTYGPFSEANVEWMETLLDAHGLIGNLIDGVGSAMKRYARDVEASRAYGNLGAYLYDECDRAMKSARLKTGFKAVTSLDPDSRDEEVAKAKELIVGSTVIDELDPARTTALKDGRVLYEEEGELRIHPKLLDPDFGATESTDDGEPSRERLIDEYLRKAESFETELASGEREDLRYDVEDALIDVIEWFGSQRANVTDTSTVDIPGFDRPDFGVTSFTRRETGGRARKLQPTSGGLEAYDTEYLTFALLEDESLADTEIKRLIQDLYMKDYRDSGVFVFTDKPTEEWTDPGWLEEAISDHRQWTPAYTWGDVIQRVRVASLREPWTLGQIADNREFENTVECIDAIRTLSMDHLAPDLYENLWDLTGALHEAAVELHETAYEKYDGPTLSEAHALSEVKDLIEEQGFITAGDLVDLRGGYRAELQSLIDSGGLKRIEGTNDVLVFMTDEYGGISHLTGRSVDEFRDLRPIPTAVLNKLEEIAEMQSDLSWVYSDSDIEDAIAELESRKTLIDHFLTGDAAFASLADDMDGIDPLSTVKEEIDTVRSGFDHDAYSRVTTLLAEDRTIWDEITDLSDTDISDLHRTLFYARVVADTPQAAAEYLETDDEYPTLFHEAEVDVREAIGQLKETEDAKLTTYEQQTESLIEMRDDVIGFVHDGDTNE